MSLPSQTTGALYCPACGSGLAATARQCAACSATIGVEVTIAPVREGRLAYQAAGAILQFDRKAAPSVGEIQRALQAGGFKFVTAHDWDQAMEFVQALQAMQVQSAVSYRASGGAQAVRSPRFPAMLVTVLLLLVAIAGGAWVFLQPSPPPEPQAQTEVSPQPGAPEGAQPPTESESVTVTIPDVAQERRARPEERPRLRFDAIGRSIVVISTETGALGSGFVVAPGQIITNRHVLQGLWTGSTVKLEYITADGTSAKTSGRVSAVGRRLDLAVVSCGGDCEDLPVLPLGRAADTAVGDTVFALGNPLGLSFSLSKGILSNNARALDELLFVQADIAVNPGNSGGPLLNASGEVIGIVTAKALTGEGIGFALPIEYALQGGDPVLQDVLPVERDFSPGMRGMMERAGVKPGTETVSGGLQSRTPAVRKEIRLVGAFAPANNPGNAYLVRFLVGKEVGEVSGANARYYLMLEHRSGYRGTFPLTNLRPWRYNNAEGTVAVYAFEQQGRLEGVPQIGPGDRVSIRMNDDLISNPALVQDVR